MFRIWTSDMLVFQRLVESHRSPLILRREMRSSHSTNITWLFIHFSPKLRETEVEKKPDLDSLSTVCTVYISIYLSHLSMCPLNRGKKETSLTSRARTNFSFNHPAAFLCKPQASPSVGRRHGSSRFLAGRFPGLVFLALLGMRSLAFSRNRFLMDLGFGTDIGASLAVAIWLQLSFFPVASS